MWNQFAKHKEERQSPSLAWLLPVSTLGKESKLSYGRKNWVSSQCCLAKGQSQGQDGQFVIPGCSTDSLISRGNLPDLGTPGSLVILPAFPGHKDPPSAPVPALLEDQVAVASYPHKAQLLPAGSSICCHSEPAFQLMKWTSGCERLAAAALLFPRKKSKGIYL